MSAWRGKKKGTRDSETGGAGWGCMGKTERPMGRETAQRVNSTRRKRGASKDISEGVRF